jgi:hypothetical protein
VLGADKEAARAGRSVPDLPLRPALRSCEGCTARLKTSYSENCATLLFARERTAIDRLETAGQGVVNRGDDQWQVMLEDVRFGARQGHNCNGAPGKVCSKASVWSPVKKTSMPSFSAVRKSSPFFSLTRATHSLCAFVDARNAFAVRLSPAQPL